LNRTEIESMPTPALKKKKKKKKKQTNKQKRITYELVQHVRCKAQLKMAFVG